VEDQETLQACTVVCQLPDSIQAQIHNFLTNGIMATSKVVGGIFFATDQLLWVKKLPICSGSNFINDSWLQIQKHGTRNMLTGTCLTEKCVECIISTANGLVTRHLSIRLDAVLETVKLPTGIADLNTGLANMDRNALPHCRWLKPLKPRKKPLKEWKESRLSAQKNQAAEEKCRRNQRAS
jgi:hypothetical protein